MRERTPARVPAPFDNRLAPYRNRPSGARPTSGQPGIQHTLADVLAPQCNRRWRDRPPPSSIRHVRDHRMRALTRGGVAEFPRSNQQVQDPDDPIRSGPVRGLRRNQANRDLA